MAGLGAKLTGELIGTFALTFIGAGAIVVTTYTGGHPGLVGIALAHGVVLAIVVSATMNISGGHINPAVTLAMVATGRIKIVPAIAYIIAQCAGAIVAGFLLAYIFGSISAGPASMSGSDAIAKSMLGTPNFNTQLMTFGSAILIESILTFLLVFAIFGTAVDDRAPHIGGWGIGLMVGVDILMGGPLTGAAMNPARTIGTLIGGGSVTSGLWSQHAVYWIGPVLGAILGALAYDIFILKPRRDAVG
jgi:MIP family channel proteins